MIFDKTGEQDFTEYAKEAREKVKNRISTISEHAVSHHTENNQEDKTLACERLMLRLEKHTTKL